MSLSLLSFGSCCVALGGLFCFVIETAYQRTTVCNHGVAEMRQQRAHFPLSQGWGKALHKERCTGCTLKAE